MKHENENMRMMKLVCFHWLIAEVENVVPFLLFLFVIDEECATMVTEPLQHEQPMQPQHQSKTVTRHVGYHQTVPLIGLMVLTKTMELMMVTGKEMVMTAVMMMAMAMNMVMDLVPPKTPQGPAPLSKTCHSSAFPLQH